MKTIQVQPSCRPQQLPHTCCKAAASSLQSAQKHTQDCGTHTHARNCILQQYFSPLISGLDSIFSKTILLVAVFYLPDASHHLHAAVLLSVCLCLCVCESVSVCVCVYALEGVYSCQSQAEEAEEEATFSSFSTGLLALCNRSELPLPGSPTSMITTLTESRSYHKNRYDKTEKSPSYVSKNNLHPLIPQ